MATVNQILKFIRLFAPEDMQEDWDNVGLLCGHRNKEVKRVLVALDPFEHVCREAVDMGADLLITHHPLILQPTKTVTDDDLIGRNILLLTRHDISLISAHTNLDRAPSGVNDVLAGVLELEGVTVINPVGEDRLGTPYGLLRCGSVEETDLDSFVDHVKAKLGTPVVRFVRGSDRVCRVAVGGGACGGEIYNALFAGCDTLVTSDVKYNQFWEAKEIGLNLIDAGHFYTENPVVHVLAATLQAAFPDLEIKVSESHADCMEFR